MLKSVRATFRSLGLVNGLLFCCSRLLQLLSAGRAGIVKYEFVAQPVPAAGLAPSRAGATRVYLASSGSADDLALLQQAPRPAEVFAQRFARGALCFLAAKEQSLAAFAWIQHNEYSEDEVRCLYRWHAPQTAVWDFDVYVAPAFRGGRLFARLWDELNRTLRARGVHWSLSRISAFNAESLAAHRRLGAMKIGSACFVVIGPLQLSLLSAAPFVHLSLRRDSRPIITLTPPQATQLPQVLDASLR